MRLVVGHRRGRRGRGTWCAWCAWCARYLGVVLVLFACSNHKKDGRSGKEEDRNTAHYASDNRADGDSGIVIGATFTTRTSIRTRRVGDFGGRRSDNGSSALVGRRGTGVEGIREYVCEASTGAGVGGGVVDRVRAPLEGATPECVAAKRFILVDMADTSRI